MYLYVIAESRAGPCKVGYAANVVTRLRTLQTGNSRQLSLIYYQEAANYRMAERVAHSMLWRHHIRREWFAVKGEDAANTVKRAIFKATQSLERQIELGRIAVAAD